MGGILLPVGCATRCRVQEGAAACAAEYPPAAGAAAGAEYPPAAAAGAEYPPAGAAAGAEYPPAAAAGAEYPPAAAAGGGLSGLGAAQAPAAKSA